MSSSTVNAASSTLQTSSRYRMNGTDLVSGLDTDSIIKNLTARTRNKITKQQQLQQKTQWKRDAFREISSLMKGFSNKYFSYTNSDTNILSSTFFNTAKLTSSSDAVSVTGDVENAKRMTVNSVSQLATQASFSSSQKVSKDEITSGAIYSDWTNSDVGGKSVIVNYKGTDYTLTMSYSVKLDSENSTVDGGAKKVADSEIQKVVDGLNDQINSNNKIKDKFSFAVTGTGDNMHITLNAADLSSITLKASASSLTDKSGVNFLSALGFSSSTSGSSIISNAPINKNVYTSGLFNKTISSSSYLEINYGGEDYTVKLGENLDILNASSSQVGSAIAKQLNSQFELNSGLKSKISASADASGNVTLKATDPSKNISIAGGSKDLVDGLGLPTGTSSNSISGTLKTSALTASNLGDTLAGSSITLNLDGIKKTVTFDAINEPEYSTTDGIKNYLQGKLTTAFGTVSEISKVTVAITGPVNGLYRLVFKTPTDDTSVLSFSSSSDSLNILNETGALRINVGETNRTETSKTLKELSSEFVTPLDGTVDGNYTMNVNGKDFTFTKDTTLGTVISTINGDGDAGVTISYSQTQNSFRVVADDSGSQGKVVIKDALNDRTSKGNLAEVLFGISGTNYTATDGADLKMSICLNGNPTPTAITRSSNNFTIDGVSLQINSTFNVKADGTIDDPTKKATFSATNETDDLYKKVVDFVNEYNKIIDDANTQTSQTVERNSKHKVKYEPLTDDQKKTMTDDEIKKWETNAKKGLLQNDNALNSILSDMNTAMTSAVASANMSLYQIGITTPTHDYTSGGQLTIDTDKLKSALKSDPEKIQEMFTATDGISQRVKKVLDKNVGTFGGDGVLLLKAGTDSNINDTSDLTTQIKDYDARITSLKTTLQTEEDRYWDKFTAMEQSLSVLTSQSQYLTSMLGGGSN